MIIIKKEVDMDKFRSWIINEAEGRGTTQEIASKIYVMIEDNKFQ